MSEPLPCEVCPKHEMLESALERIEPSMRDGFESVNRTLRDVAADLRQSAVAVASIETRLRLVERVTFGAVGLALTGLVAAVLALVLKT